MKPIKLNKEKRELLKSKWKHIVMNNMPLQVDDDLKEAQENYRTVRSDVWDEVITPNVEANFPMADMEILQKYSRRNQYNSFTDTDRCFVFKPNFTDDITEKRFDWGIDNDCFRALYHNELLSLNCDPTLCVEYEETKRSQNPHYHEQYNKLDCAKEDVVGMGNFPEDLALNSHGYAECDYGKYTKVVVSGGCHSRAMMTDETSWEKLNSFVKSRSQLINAHRELWKVKYQLITDMRSVIDQAKTLEEVEIHWGNVRECVNFEKTTIGTDLQIVSEETATRLSQAINNINLSNNVAIVVDNNSVSVN